MLARFKSKSERAVAAIHSNFVEKFKGRSDFVTKEGVICLLFKESQGALDKTSRVKCKTEAEADSPVLSKSKSLDKDRNHNSHLVLPLIHKDKRINVKKMLEKYTQKDPHKNHKLKLDR